ncbi:MAG: putative sulfate exporter family transporter, partial [Cyclobacteriaceae bacterium]|nr:putative sulfate exporter family transporter [Cyclobacteriaceae bacterium]
NYAISLELLAQEASYKNEERNSLAAEASKNWNEALTDFDKARKKVVGNQYNILPNLSLFALALALIFGLGAYFMGHNYVKFIIAFIGVFFLAVLSYLFAAQTDMKNLGISYAVWAILFGLIISNTIGTPGWLKPAIQTEYFIKTGLVLLGSEILLGKIMAIGLPGIFVSWVVTPIVLVTTFWFGQKILKIGSKTLNITISADMSVCGVSAAIATAAACNAKKEELTLAVGLSMVFTSIMMIVMPAFINAVGMPEVLGGAWIGGTIDATGAVVAAGAFLGDKALNVAATIKMIQNVLIGLIAFAVAFYWATKVENTGDARVGMSEIWLRFPKFIIGFLGASIVFSILYAALSKEFSYAFIDHGIIRGFTKDLRGWLFCLAFVSIGLSVNFKELKHHFSGGKPLILYVCGQSLNLLLTLLMAYLMFYIVFPEITDLI